MTANKRLQFQICLSNAETEDTTSSLAHTKQVTKQLEREIYGITSNEQKRFQREFSICLIQFEGWWDIIGIQEPQKSIEQHLIHFGYTGMHLVSHISESSQQMRSGEKFTSVICEWLHSDNLKEPYRSTTTVSCIRQLLKHNDRCIGLDYKEETLSSFALQGWYDIDLEQVFNLLSATDKRRSTQRAHLLPLQTIDDKPIIHPVSQIHSSHIICEKLMSAECVEVSN
jgi:hypothetical protein